MLAQRIPGHRGQTSSTTVVSWRNKARSPSHAVKHRVRRNAAVNHFSNSHLEDELEFMQHSLHLEVQHHETQQSSASLHEDAACDAFQGELLRVCELGLKSDAVETMQQLRGFLIEHGSCILTVLENRPDVLLDAVSVLHLLNQDLRLEEDYSTSIFFQPMLTPPKPAAGTAKSSSTSSTSMALLVTRTKAPDLLKLRPSSIIGLDREKTPAAAIHGPSQTSAAQHQPSNTSHVWDMADMLVDKLDSYAGTQLRCTTANGLVIAFSALQRARKLVKLAGDADLLVSPHIATTNGIPTIGLNCWRKKGPAGLHTEDRPH